MINRVSAILLCLICSGISFAGSSELIVCGWNEVYIIDIASTDPRPKKLWTWKAADHSEIPEDIRKRFGTTDECKPVRGGSKILITSSGGGIALVDRASGKPEFWAVVPYAHSADILPNGRIVVAGSTSATLVVLDRESPEEILYKAELLSAHGVVWDNRRQTLWALGDREIRSYRLRRWYSDAPYLELSGTYPLPEAGGHDLYPVPGTSKLSVSTRAHCYLFDRVTHGLEPHDLLPKALDVKGLSLHPETGRLACVRAKAPNWWSDEIHLLNPAGTVHLPGERIYKARWYR